MPSSKNHRAHSGILSTCENTDGEPEMKKHRSMRLQTGEASERQNGALLDDKNGLCYDGDVNSLSLVDMVADYDTEKGSPNHYLSVENKDLDDNRINNIMVRTSIDLLVCPDSGSSSYLTRSFFLR
jgi:hypothetical protein